MKHLPSLVIAIFLLSLTQANAQRKQGLLIMGQANTIIAPFQTDNFLPTLPTTSHRRAGFGGSIGYYVQSKTSFAGVTVNYASYRAAIETTYDKDVRVHAGNAIGATGLVGVRILLNEHNSIDFGGGLSLSGYYLPDSANKKESVQLSVTHSGVAIGASALLNYNADLGPLHLLVGVQACFIPLQSEGGWSHGGSSFPNGGSFEFSRSWVGLNLGIFIPWQVTEPK